LFGVNLAEQRRDISEISSLNSPSSQAGVHIMKLKNLRKKIRRLEKRLREGPKKLAKLRRKLEAVEALKKMEARKQSAARARARQTVKSSQPIEKKLPAKMADAKKQSAVKKGTRKAKLSPEHRAQIAAAMKARWAAKRAVVEALPEIVSTDQASTFERTPQAAESRHEGA
jgi:predicted  nucleic acid-binding Zn-ribbon protein